jgi:hypothetical protein
MSWRNETLVYAPKATELLHERKKARTANRRHTTRFSETDQQLALVDAGAMLTAHFIAAKVSTTGRLLTLIKPMPE